MKKFFLGLILVLSSLSFVSVSYASENPQYSYTGEIAIGASSVQGFIDARINRFSIVSFMRSYNVPDDTWPDMHNYFDSFGFYVALKDKIRVGVKQGLRGLYSKGYSGVGLNYSTDYRKVNFLLDAGYSFINLTRWELFLRTTPKWQSPFFVSLEGDYIHGDLSYTTTDHWDEDIRQTTIDVKDNFTPRLKVGYKYKLFTAGVGGETQFITSSSERKNVFTVFGRVDF